MNQTSGPVSLNRNLLAVELFMFSLYVTFLVGDRVDQVLKTSVTLIDVPEFQVLYRTVERDSPCSLAQLSVLEQRFALKNRYEAQGAS